MTSSWSHFKVSSSSHLRSVASYNIFGRPFSLVYRVLSPVSDLFYTSSFSSHGLVIVLNAFVRSNVLKVALLVLPGLSNVVLKSSLRLTLQHWQLNARSLKRPMLHTLSFDVPSPDVNLKGSALPADPK